MDYILVTDIDFKKTSMFTSTLVVVNEVTKANSVEYVAAPIITIEATSENIKNDENEKIYTIFEAMSKVSAELLKYKQYGVSLAGYNVNYDIRELKKLVDNNIRNPDKRIATAAMSVSRGEFMTMLRSFDNKDLLKNKENQYNKMDIYRKIRKLIVEDKKLAKDYVKFALTSENVSLSVDFAKNQYNVRVTCLLKQDTVAQFYKIYNTEVRTSQSHEAKEDVEDLIKIINKIQQTKNTKITMLKEADSGSSYSILKVTPEDGYRYGYGTIPINYDDGIINIENLPPVRFPLDSFFKKDREYANTFYNLVIPNYNIQQFVTAQGTIDIDKLKAKVVSNISSGKVDKINMIEVLNTYEYSRVATSNVLVRKSLKEESKKTKVKAITTEEIEKVQKITTGLAALSNMKAITAAETVINVTNKIEKIKYGGKSRHTGILERYRFLFEELGKTNRFRSNASKNKIPELCRRLASMPKDDNFNLAFSLFLINVNDDMKEIFLRTYVQVAYADKDADTIKKETIRIKNDILSEIDTVIQIANKLGKIVKSIELKSQDIQIPNRTEEAQDFYTQRILYLSEVLDVRTTTKSKDNKQNAILEAQIFASLEYSIISKTKIKFKRHDIKMQSPKFNEKVNAGIDGYFYVDDINSNGVFMYYHISYKNETHLILGFNRNDGRRAQSKTGKSGAGAPDFYFYKGIDKKRIKEMLISMARTGSIGKAFWETIGQEFVLQDFSGKDTTQRKNQKSSKTFVKLQNSIMDIGAIIPTIQRQVNTKKTMTYVEDYRLRIQDEYNKAMEVLNKLK